MSARSRGQIEELTVTAKAGADGIVLVTNRLDPKAPEPRRSAAV